jgi:hypothetical protein
MPDLFVDGTLGTDTPASGTTAADPLRSLTFAVEEGVRRFGTSRTAIHLAAGTYGTATGEVFPIEMPQNISVFGAGEGATVVEFARSASDGFELALSGGEELAAFTLRGLPLTVSGCFQSTGIWLSIGSSFVHDLTIEIGAGSAVEEVAFGTGIQADNRARIERVHVARCATGIAYGGDHAGLGVAGHADVLGCRFIGNSTGISATGPGLIQFCTFDGCHTGVSIRSGVNTVLEGSGIDRCTWAVTVERGVSDGLLPIVRGNRIHARSYGVMCWGAALVEGNDIVADLDAFGILVDSAFPARRTADPGASSPTFRNNTIGRMVYDSSRRQMPLAQFGHASAPVVEGNRFWADAGFAFDVIAVHHDANPDLGGGSRGSAGNNRFEGGWLVFFQDDMSPPKEIFAHNNFWRRAPPMAGSGTHVPGDHYVEPQTRRDTVVVRADGARAF